MLILKKKRICETSAIKRQTLRLYGRNYSLFAPQSGIKENELTLNANLGILKKKRGLTNLPNHDPGFFIVFVRSLSSQIRVAFASTHKKDWEWKSRF